MELELTTIIEKSSNELQTQLMNILSKYEKSKSLATSLMYLFIDICINIISFSVFFNFFDLQNPLYYILYSIVQGTLFINFWVLGHECGHHAFSHYKIINNLIGFVIHTSLLVPYFAWQFSHGKHHRFTNNLVNGETHVPSLKNNKEQQIKNNIHKIFGEDAFVLFNVVFHLLLGWPLYLFKNITGGRTQSDLKTKKNKHLHKSHFHPYSQIFTNAVRKYILLDDIGLIAFIFIILYNNLLYYYVGPYIVANMWLVLYTWLHHTDKNIPHYGLDEFTYLRGALSTCDRTYNPIINFLHHDIGRTHVLHHINSRIAHYHSRQATEEILPLIKDYYHYDDRNILSVLYDVSKNCHYVDDLNGIQYLKKYT